MNVANMKMLRSISENTQKRQDFKWENLLKDKGNLY